jgi:formate C-acetyltransferase
VESPFRGTDERGPTAVIKSVAKLDHILLSGGAILNVKFQPEQFDSEEKLKLLAALIRTYFELQGMELQFNVVSARALRDAQRHPENYPDLLIRVAGYSAYFVTLDPAVQNDIIARTEHHL